MLLSNVSSLGSNLSEKHDTMLNIVVSQGWPQAVCGAFDLSTKLFLDLKTSVVSKHCHSILVLLKELAYDSSPIKVD